MNSVTAHSYSAVKKTVLSAMPIRRASVRFGDVNVRVTS